MKKGSDWAFRKIEQIANCAIAMNDKLAVGITPESGREALHYLPKPDGTIMPIGYDGDNHVMELAAEALKRNNLDNRASVNSAINFLKPLIAKALTVDIEGVDEVYCDKLLRDTGKALAKQCYKRTHFFPVYLMGDQAPDTLDLGPVRFHNKPTLRAVFAAGIKRDAEGRHYKEERLEKILDRAIEHYGQFNWVAEVTVSNCDADRSLEIATKTVRRAVDFLHLIIGRAWTNRFSPSPSLPGEKWKYHLTLTDDKDIEFQQSTLGLLEVKLGKDWPGFLDDPDEAFFMSKARQLLEVAVNPNPEGPLALRFLDALQWYGEAVRDKSPASAVVKYTLCLERLLVTDDNGEITKTLADRLSTFGMPEAHRTSELRQTIDKDMRAGYALRSKLVHGAMSPDDPKVIAGLGNCGDLAERGLKMYLVAFPSHIFTKPKWGPKQLRDVFQQIEKIVADEIAEKEAMTPGN